MKCAYLKYLQNGDKWPLRLLFLLRFISLNQKKLKHAPYHTLSYFSCSITAEMVSGYVVSCQSSAGLWGQFGFKVWPWAEKFNSALYVKWSSRLIEDSQLCSKSLCTRQLQRIAGIILKDDSHPLNDEFQLLPSGWRFLVPACKTKHYKTASSQQPLMLLTRCRNSVKKGFIIDLFMFCALFMLFLCTVFFYVLTWLYIFSCLLSSNILTD